MITDALIYYILFKSVQLTFHILEDICTSTNDCKLYFSCKKKENYKEILKKR